MNKTLGMLINSSGNEEHDLVSHVFKMIKHKKINLCIFSKNVYNFSTFDSCVMSAGTLQSFNGDLITFCTEDTIFALENKRAYNIKHIVSTSSIRDIFKLFSYNSENIEYLSVGQNLFENYHKCLMLEKMRTVEEYINE